MRETLVCPGRAGVEHATFDTSTVVAAYRRRTRTRHTLLGAPPGEVPLDLAAAPGSEVTESPAADGSPGC